MAKKKTSTKNSYKKQHEKFVREQNERCFLDNKQEIQYHSFILLEIIPLEKINNLIKGLDRLYAGASVSLKSRLDYKKILSKSHSKLFQWNTMPLPYITTDKLKGKVLPNCVFHDLGENIRHYHITIYKVLPSTVILQIQVYLDDKISKKINDVIYKYHKEVKEPIETPKGKYTKIYGPEHQKESEIYAFRQDLHKEATGFLKQYFEGYFFELSNSDVSVIPIIDLFSLEYPVNEEEIFDWGIKHSGFFHCFSTHIIPYDSFKYENYLLCLESKRDSEFKNYLILANKKTSANNMYPDLDSAIEETINHCSFDLLAIDRWVRIQEEVVGSLNMTVSEEILNIKDNKFDKAIDTRKTVLQKIFSFERFVFEFKRYGVIPDKFPFKSIKDKRNPERQFELFKGLRKGISERIKEIYELINGFTRQYETILNLKNVEFSKIMQNKVFILTVVVVILALAQIIIGIIALKRPDIIIRLLLGG